MARNPNYVDEQQLADYLRVGDLDDHVEAGFAISTSSRIIDFFCGRQFGVDDTPVERTYTPHPDYYKGWWTVDIDDLAASPVTVAVDGDEVDTFELGPTNAVADGKVWTRLSFTSDSEYRPTCTTDPVTITAAWGWSSVPETIVQATLLQASRLLKRRESPFGISGSPEMQGELRLLAKIDPDVEVILRPYKRQRVIR